MHGRDAGTAPVERGAGTGLTGLPERLRLAIVVVAVANLVAQPLRALLDVRATDAVAYMAAARVLSAGGNPYCLGCDRVQAAAYAGTPPGATNITFLNPPAVAWMVRPLALLPAPVGVGIFIAAMALAGAAAAFLLGRGLASRHRGFAVVTAFAAGPVAWGFALGQWDGLVVLCMVGAASLLSEAPLAAGVVLAVGLVKPQLIWLIPPLLVVNGRWRTVVGCAAGAAGWVAASLLTAGPRSLGEWLMALGGHAPASGTVENASLAGLLGQLTGRPAVTIAVAGLLAVVGLGLCWRARQRLSDPLVLVAAGAVISLTASPYLHPDDLIVAAPAVALVAGHRPISALIWVVAISCAWGLGQWVPALMGLVPLMLLAGAILFAMEVAGGETHSRAPEAPTVAAPPARVGKL